MTTAENKMVAGAEASLKFALAAAELAANTRAEDVVLLDLRGRSPVTEFFVIATGTSPRQMRTVAEELQDLGKKMGFKAWQTSGLESGKWILVDCVTLVAHIFDEESRDFYDLELLWGDCPRIDWRKELGLPAAGSAERVRARIPVGAAARSDEEDEGAELVELEEPDEDGEGVKLVETEVEENEVGVSFPERVEGGEETEEEQAMHLEETGERVEEALADEEREVVGEEEKPKTRNPKRKTGGKEKGVAKKKPAARGASVKVKKSKSVEGKVAGKVVKRGVKKVASKKAGVTKRGVAKKSGGKKKKK